MLLNVDDKPTIYPNALKHLSEEDVLDAWYSAAESVEREIGGEPRRWLSIGFCSKGSVGLVSVENDDGYMIIHAFSPVRKKFQKEIDAVKRRKR